MTAGRRDSLITLQHFTATTDEYGEEVETWADLGQEWAAVFYGRGDERRQAAVEQGKQSANFQVLSNDLTRSVSIKDRIDYDGSLWDIVGISPMDRSQIEYTAVRAS